MVGRCLTGFRLHAVLTISMVLDYRNARSASVRLPEAASACFVDAKREESGPAVGQLWSRPTGRNGSPSIGHFRGTSVRSYRKPTFALRTSLLRCTAVARLRWPVGAGRPRAGNRQRPLRGKLFRGRHQPRQTPGGGTPSLPKGVVPRMLETAAGMLVIVDLWLRPDNDDLLHRAVLPLQSRCSSADDRFAPLVLTA